LQWLETFVNSETSQIQMVALSVQRLCDELGCSNEHPKLPGVLADVGRKSGILADIQQLLLENKNRDQHIEALRAAVNGLTDVVHKDIRQNAEARNVMSKSSSTLWQSRILNVELQSHSIHHRPD